MVVVGVAVSAMVGGAIGASNGAGGATGVVFGGLLGPIGWIIVALSGRKPEPATVLDRVERDPGAPGWHPDPLGRFDSRWFDGDRWTQHVGRVGPDGARSQFEDPI